MVGVTCYVTVLTITCGTVGLGVDESRTVSAGWMDNVDCFAVNKCLN